MSLSTLTETMQQIEKEINRNPEPVSQLDLVYQFNIEGQIFQLQLKDGQGKILEGVQADPDCTLIMSYEIFLKFLAGKLNGMTAFMTGKLKIEGDMMKALKLENLVKQYELDI